ncbi:hypothetical protein M3Y96_00603400 [Aphelenchoides besseyi]|nr:hypothetical protein M3Y96_00603400 [Aphelenchoides besseyi]
MCVDRGCVSMWNDDVGMTGGGLFQLEPFNMFNQTPADYYFRPYYEYLYQNILKRKLCVNGEFVTSRFLNIFERFTTKYAEKCHISFNSISALTYDNPNNLELLDQPLADVLERMKDIGALDNTAIVISSIQETYIGRIEERMPILSIYIPPKYRKANPKKFGNLRTNTNRLVSSFDIYRTLHDMTSPKTSNKEVGSSLFDLISRTRTCQQARIPPQFCMCMERMGTTILNETHKFEARALMRTQVHEALHELPCIFSYRIAEPRAYLPFTISAIARNGFTVMAERFLFLANENSENANENEITELEMETPVHLRWSSEDSEDETLSIRTRIHLNRVTGQLYTVAKPWVVNENLDKPIDEECSVKILDHICACAPNTKITNPRLLQEAKRNDKTTAGSSDKTQINPMETVTSISVTRSFQI